MSENDISNKSQDVTDLNLGGSTEPLGQGSIENTPPPTPQANMGDAKIADDQSLQQSRQQARDLAEKSLDHKAFYKLYPDLQKQDETAPGISETASVMLNLAYRTQQPIDEIKKNFEEYKAGYARQQGWDANISEGGMRSKFQEQFTKENNIQKASQEAQHQAVTDAMQDAGSASMSSVPILQRYNEWNAKNAALLGDMPDGERLKTFQSVYAPVREMLASPDASLAKQIVDAYGNLPMGDQEMAGIKETASKTAQADPILNALGITSREGLPTDAEAAKKKEDPILDQLASKTPEERQNIYRIAAMMEQAKNPTKTGFIASLYSMGQAASRAVDSDIETDNSPRHRVALELKEASKNIINPLLYSDSSATESLPVLATKIGQGVFGAAPYIAASAIAGPEVGLAYMTANMIADQQTRLMVQNPTMSADQAFVAGTAIAVPQAVAMGISMRGMTGAFPALDRAVEGMGMGAVSKYLVNTGISGSGFMAANAIDAVGNYFINEINPEWNKDAKLKEGLIEVLKNSPVDFGMAMIFSAFHVGAEVNIDKVNKLAADPANLVKQGIPQDVAEQVAATRPAERPAALFKALNDVTEEQRQKGIAISKAEADAVKARANEPDAPKLQTLDNGDHVVLVSDAKGGMQEVFRSQDQEAASHALGVALVAHDRGQIDHFNKLLDYFKQSDEAQGVADKRKYETSLKEVTFEDMREQGVPLEQLKERMRIAGISEDTALSNVLVEGLTKSDLYEDAIRVFNMNPRTAIHERIDATTQRAINEGKVTPDQFISWVRQTEGATGYEYLPKDGEISHQQIVEAVTSIGEEYAAGRLMDKNVSPGLKSFFKALMQYFRNVLSRAKVLKEAMQSGKIDANFEEHLARSIGLPIEDRLSPAEAKAKLDMMGDNAGNAPMPEQGTFFSISKSRPVWADEFEEVGGVIDSDGTILLYHATSAESAKKILETGVLKRPPDAPDSYGIYASSSKLVSEDYGDGTIVPIRVRTSDVSPDDVFPGRRMDFSAKTKNGIFKPVAVGEKAEINGKPVSVEDAPKDQTSFSIREKDALKDITSDLSQEDKDRFFNAVSEFGKIDKNRASADFWNGMFKGKKVTPEDVGAIQKQLGEWKAYYSKQNKGASKEEQPKSTNPIQDVLDRYNEGDDAISTPGDLVNELDGLAGELDLPELEDAVREYKDARREERELYGERAGLDDAAVENLIAVAQKIANESGTSFSITTREQRDRIQQELEKRIASSPTARTRIFENAAKRFDSIGKRQDVIMEAFAAGNASSSDVIRKDMESNLVELNAILSAIPPEARASLTRNWRNPSTGEPGNIYSKYASLGSDKAKADFLVKTIEKADKEVERILQREYQNKLQTLLKNAKPRKGDNGVRKSTLGPVAQQFADKAYEASLLDNDATVARLESLEREIRKAEDPQKEADLVEEWAITNAFGALSDQSAAKLKTAIDLLKDTLSGGREARRIAEQQRIDDIRAKQVIISDALPGWTDSGLNKANDRANGIADLTRQMLWSHASYEQILRRILPPEAQGLATEWADRIRRANNATETAGMKYWQDLMGAIHKGIGGNGFLKTADAIQELGKKVEGKISKMEGRRVELESIPIDKAEQLVRGDMARGEYTADDLKQMEEALIATPITSKTKSISIYRVIEEGRKETIPMSLDEMIFTTMAWEQADVRAKMENSGWTQESYDAMKQEIAASKVASSVKDYLKEFYRNSTKELNPVYTRMYGMELPENPNYAPTSYESRKANGEMSIDGSATQNSTTPGFAKARVTHNEAFKIEPATQIYQRRSLEQAQWVAFAELHREMSAVLNGKNVRLALKQANGKRLSDLTGQVLDNLAKGGGMNTDAAYMKKWLGAATSGTAVASMGYNLKTIFNQFDSVTRFLYAMPVKDVLKAMVNPKAVLDAVPKAWNSEVVQNRIIQGANPAARFALKQAGMTPGKFLAAWYGIGAEGLKPMQYADGALTTLSSAIVYSDAHAKALKAGLSEKEAEARALDAMEAAIHRFSQPVTFSAKSPVENNSNAAMKLLYMFASDARLKTGIILDAVQSIKDGKGSKAEHLRRIGVVFASAMMAQTVSNIYRDIFSDDTDEEIWTAGSYAKAAALAPFQGLFLLGTAIDVAMSSLTGQKAYSNSSNPLVNAGNNALVAGKHASDILQTDDGEAFFKELGRIARAISLSPVTAVPAAVLNPVKPIVGAKKNLESQD